MAARGMEDSNPNPDSTSAKEMKGNSRILRFCEAIERWRDEPEAPEYVDALISTPIRDLQALHYPRKVDKSTTVVQAIEAFKGGRNIVVNQQNAPCIYSRLTFLESAFQAGNFLDPISTILPSIPSLQWVDGFETLDTALQRMIESGFEEIGVTSEGLMTGVVYLDDIYDFLLREVAICVDDVTAEVRTDSRETFKRTDDRGESKSLRHQQDRQINEITPLQLSALEWCGCGWTEGLIFFCVLLDISSAITEWVRNADSSSDGDKLLVATGIILFVYVYDMSIRVFGRRTALLKYPFEYLDTAIVAVSALVYILVLSNSVDSDSRSVMVTRILRLLRQIKVIRFFAKLYMSQQLRYREDGFNLDLSYITNSCIAMSQPVLFPDATFPNRIRDLHNFFTTKYPGRYRIFDLCQEAAYDGEHFGGRVERVPVENHNPPRMAQLVAFVERAGRFLEAADAPARGSSAAAAIGGHGGGGGTTGAACIAVHCSVGAGRTGVMIAAWLLYSAFSHSADDAIRWFSQRRIGKRGNKFDGVAMASQRRYVTYMQEALAAGGYYTKRLRLQRVMLRKPPLPEGIRLSRLRRFSGGKGGHQDSAGASNLWLTIEQDGIELFRSSPADNIFHGLEDSESGTAKVGVGGNEEDVIFDVRLLVAGDVRIVFWHRDEGTGRDQLCCFLCMHTGFITSRVAIFEKPEVDMAADDLKCNIFPRAFAVHLVFDDIPIPPDHIECGHGGPVRASLNSKYLHSTDSIDADGGSVDWDPSETPTALGPFRRIQKAGEKVLEAAALMRYRDRSVQARFARRLHQRVSLAAPVMAAAAAALGTRESAGWATRRRSTRTSLSNLAEELVTRTASGRSTVGSLGDGTAALCCAGGPVVRHEPVRMYAVEDAPGSAGHGGKGGKLQGQSSLWRVGTRRPTELLKPLARSMQGIARTLVSGNKRRFTEDGFDLDLTYVTPRIVAMGFPSQGLESSYRNPAKEVYRFFQTRHAAHYLIVNLCSEREYELDLFHGNCVRYPFPDHSPPALELIMPCCARIHKFLQMDPDNVVAVHCKAGKGRTGLIVVSYLMYCGLAPSAVTARGLYDWARTKDGKGLTITSQIRYAHYFEEYLRHLRGSGPPPPLRQDLASAVRLLRIRLRTAPNLAAAGGGHLDDIAVTVSVKSERDHATYSIFAREGGASGAHAAGDSPPLSPISGSKGLVSTGRWGQQRGQCYDYDLVEPSKIGSGTFRKARSKEVTNNNEAGAAMLLRSNSNRSEASEEGSEGVRVAGDFEVLMRTARGRRKLLFFWLHSAFLIGPPAQMGGRARPLREQNGNAPDGFSAYDIDAKVPFSAPEHEDHAGSGRPDRTFSDSECAEEGLPEGTWVLSLTKQDLDCAARDKRCAVFDPDFGVDLFFLPLPEGCTGAGAALEETIASAASSSNTVGVGMGSLSGNSRDSDEGSNEAGGSMPTSPASRSSAAVAEVPLAEDREGYKHFLMALSSLSFGTGPAATGECAQAPSFEDWLLGRGSAAEPAVVAAAAVSLATVRLPAERGGLAMRRARTLARKRSILHPAIAVTSLERFARAYETAAMDSCEGDLSESSAGGGGDGAGATATPTSAQTSPLQPQGSRPREGLVNEGLQTLLSNDSPIDRVGGNGQAVNATQGLRSVVRLRRGSVESGEDSPSSGGGGRRPHSVTFSDDVVPGLDSSVLASAGGANETNVLFMTDISESSRMLSASGVRPGAQTDSPSNSNGVKAELEPSSQVAAASADENGRQLELGIPHSETCTKIRDPNMGTSGATILAPPVPASIPGPHGQMSGPVATTRSEVATRLHAAATAQLGLVSSAAAGPTPAMSASGVRVDGHRHSDSGEGCAGLGCGGEMR